MNALREREINNNLERRLSEEQKLRGELNLLLLFKSSSIEICIQFVCHVSLRPNSDDDDDYDDDDVSQTKSIKLLIFIGTCCKKIYRSIEIYFPQN